MIGTSYSGGGSWGGQAEGKRGGAAVSDSTAKQGKGARVMQRRGHRQ
jgi:hypothetical protein